MKMKPNIYKLIEHNKGGAKQQVQVKKFLWEKKKRSQVTYPVVGTHDHSKTRRSNTEKNVERKQ